MFSYCDLSAEFELQDISWNSNGLCCQPSSNSTYYEESPLYTEISEPHIKIDKRIKRNCSKHSALCPVEIRQESTLNIDLPPILWHKYDSIPKFLNIINTGRTILINGQWTKGKPYITGGPLNGSYIFSQIHFHSPSEHEIDGMRYPLEMHVVHYKTTYLTQEKAMQEKDGTVVIVYLFQMLKSTNSSFSCITDFTHLIKNVNDRTELKNITLDQILQPIASNYYIYWGSVATSKKSYSLQWIISCNKLYVSQNEVDKMSEILCANEPYADSQASRMNIINNTIYHVEDYDLTLEEVNCKDDTSKCCCRFHIQKCKICANNKGICLQLSSTETQCCTSKKRNIESQTSCEKASKATSKSSLCIYKRQSKKIKQENLKGSNSLVIIKVPNCLDSDVQKQINFAEAETSSCPSSEKNIKPVASGKAKKSKKKEKESNKKKIQQSETNSCDTKSFVKNSKTQNTKKTAKNTPENRCRDSCLETKMANMKEKQKKQKKSGNKRSESSASSSKSSEVVKQKKKKNNSKNKKECPSQTEIALVPVLVSTSTAEEKVLEKKCDCTEEINEERRIVELKKEIDESPVVCEKLIQPLKDVIAEISTCSGPNNDIKTIFENKSDFNNSEDYAINFLLAPNTFETKYPPMATGSERNTEVAQNINSNSETVVKEFVNEITKTGLSSDLPLDQSKELCFETEHFFRTKRQGDLTTCITQEYNVAVICNHNIIQEFRGTFKPDDLELGIYEKLNLVPKYPEPENFTVRLDDCFVKKETMEQLYIRVKFLVTKDNISAVESKQENIFVEEIKMPALEFSSLKDNESYCTEKKTFQQKNESETQINFTQPDLKNEISKREEYKAELVKKLNSEPKKSSKMSPQRSSKFKKEEERKDNNEIEKSDEVVKDLFSKHKKVYFSCEKVEKDENSGRKVFVGSFRTSKELKPHSTEKKLAMETKSLSLGEKEKCRFSSDDFFKSSIKTKNSRSKKDCKVQSPIKCNGSNKLNKSNETKDLITLHKHKPKKSQVNYSKNERKNIELQDGEIISPSEISSLEDVGKSEKLDVNPSSVRSVRSRKLSFNKSQTGFKTLSAEGKNSSKSNVILNEHVKDAKC